MFSSCAPELPVVPCAPLARFALELSAWELCERIDPVAILYGRGPRLFVSEHNSARRLLAELYRLGRAGIPVRGMISSLGALDRASLRAFNCYLEHSYAATSWRNRRLDGLHRHRWYAIQRETALRWVP